MTSKRPYAVAALVVAISLPLAGCAGGAAAPDREPSTASSGAAASPTPTTSPVSITAAQGKAVALLSQRETGNVYPGAPRQEALDWEVCGEKLTTEAGVTWLTGSQADPEGHTPTAAELAKITVGGSHSVVTLLQDDAARTSRDARLEKWSAGCTDPDSPATPVTVDLPRSDSTVAYTQPRPTGSLPRKHVSVVMARAGNTGIICYLEAKDVATATAAATSCAQDMLGGAALIANLSTGSGLLGARTLLASVVSRPEAKSEVTFDDDLTVGPPCGPMPDRVMSAKSASATFRPAGTDMYEPPTATAGVLVMADPAAAKAFVAQARATFGRCAGSFKHKVGPNSVPGRVLGVEDSAIGDGGLAIRDEIRFGSGKPEQGHTAIFSAGRFVVQVDQWRAGHGEVIARAIAAAAQ